jgi:hypothetical protein
LGTEGCDKAKANTGKQDLVEIFVCNFNH